MKGKRYETVSDLQKHTDAVIRAETAVVKEAKRWHKSWGVAKPLGDTWDEAMKIVEALRRLEKLEGRKP